MSKEIIRIELRNGNKGRGLLSDLRHKRLVAIADHGEDAWECGDFLRRPLRITAGHQNASFGILAVGAPDKGTCGLVGLLCHSTGIGDYDISSVSIRGGKKAAASQLGSDDFAIRSAGTATEVLNVVFCHFASLLNRRLPRSIQHQLR